MKILSLIFILSSLVYSQYQMNPDGYIGYASIHLTPMFDSGEAEYFVGSNQVGKIEYPSRFNFQAEVKFPLSSALTFSLFYRYRSMDIKFTQNNFSDETKGTLHSAGGTISFYIGSPD